MRNSGSMSEKHPNRTQQLIALLDRSSGMLEIDSLLDILAPAIDVDKNQAARMYRKSKVSSAASCARTQGWTIFSEGGYLIGIKDGRSATAEQLPYTRKHAQRLANEIATKLARLRQVQDCEGQLGLPGM